MKRKTTIILFVILIISIIAGAGIAVTLSRKVPKNPVGTVGNTAGNLYNGGLFCEDDGYVYFANPYDGDAMYRMKPDETAMEKLISTEVGSINAAGKYIYYYQKSSGAGVGFGYIISTTGVYRAEKKNPRKSFCLDKVLSENLVLADSSLYYNTSNLSEGIRFKKIDIDGSNRETLFDYKVIPACAADSTLYFSNTTDNSYLLSLRLGSKSTSVLLPEDVYMPVVDGNTVYYIDIHNNYALVRYELATGTKTVLADERTDMFNMSDLYIYYQTAGDTPMLKRVSKDGSFSEVVAEGAYRNISLTSQYAYFTRFGADTPIYKTPVNGAVNVTVFDNALQAAMEALKK